MSNLIIRSFPPLFQIKQKPSASVYYIVIANIEGLYYCYYISWFLPIKCRAEFVVAWSCLWYFILQFRCYFRYSKKIIHSSNEFVKYTIFTISVALILIFYLYELEMSKMRMYLDSAACKFVVRQGIVGPAFFNAVILLLLRQRTCWR
jgi:hypothetical protein